MLFTEFYNKLLQLFFMRNFFFILLFFSSHLIFSDEILEIYLDEQHYKLFDYINKKSDLIDEDYNGADASATILTSAGESGASDNNSISYFTPAIAGFKAGISSRDSGANGKTDFVAYGGSYTVPVAGGSCLS